MTQTSFFIFLLLLLLLVIAMNLYRRLSVVARQNVALASSITNIPTHPYKHKFEEKHEQARQIRI